MKKKNLVKSLSAMLLAGVMLVSAGAAASAAGVTGTGDAVTAIPVAKTVTTDGDTYAPNTTFTISVEPGSAGSFNDGVNDNVVYAGVDGGLTGTTISSTPSNNVGKSYEFDGSLAVNSGVFNKAGVYHYVVTEEAGNYEGIAYDTSSYDVYLYVMNGENGLYVGYAVSVVNGAKTDLAFTNDYGQNNDTTHDVKVTKVITGNQADLTDIFTFTVGVNGASGEVYKVVYTTKGQPKETSVTSGSTIDVTLGNNDTVTIYGLSENDVYSIVEQDNSDGYVATDDQKDTDEGTVFGKVLVDGTSYTVTNTKDAVTPTGIVLSVAPYVLIVALAGVLAVAFLRRRREEF